MTKVVLLKWLNEQKIKALAEVDRQRDAAVAAYNEEKYKKTGLVELVAEIEPKLQEVYDRVVKWHMDHADIIGDRAMVYGGVCYQLRPLISSNQPLLDVMKTYEFMTTQHDHDIASHYGKIKVEVEQTYDNVALNISRLANAKLGMEFLAGLGFDLSALKAADEKPVETALAVPINTAYLLLPQKEATHEH